MLMHIQWNVLTVTSCYSWQRFTLIIIILWHISYYNVYTLEKPFYAWTCAWHIYKRRECCRHNIYKYKLGFIEKHLA